MADIFEEMRPKLLTLDAARERLATLEPLSAQQFEVGSGVMFRVDPGWAHGVESKRGGDVVDCFVTIHGREFQLTKDAFMEAAKMAHMSPKHTIHTPAKYIEPSINYWYRQGHSGKDFQLLEVKDVGKVFTKKSMVPYSNLRLTESLVEGIENKYGKGEILVDYKFQNDLRSTYMRFIVPGYRRVMVDTGTADDSWSTGIQLRNSLTNEKHTELSGYLFRWWCTNGACQTQNTWDRRADRYHDTDDQSWIYDWARDSVDEILGGMESQLDQVQHSVYEPVSGESALRAIFERYGVPVKYRGAIINELLNAPGGITVYAVMQAVTRLANSDDLTGAEQDKIMRVGGDVPLHHGETCNLGTVHFQ
jgi:hypothetical protein